MSMCNLSLRWQRYALRFSACDYAVNFLCALFQPSFISTNGTGFALWASRNPGQADFVSFSRGNAVNVSSDFLARACVHARVRGDVVSRKREIYARNVTGIRRPAIFGKTPVKLHIFTLTMQKFGQFRAPVHHDMALTSRTIMPERKPEDVNGVKSFSLYNICHNCSSRRQFVLTTRCICNFFSYGGIHFRIFEIHIYVYMYSRLKTIFYWESFSF